MAAGLASAAPRTSFAQEAETAAAVEELPEIVVTAPSPVAKPKQAKPQTQKKPDAQPASAPAPKAKSRPQQQAATSDAGGSTEGQPSPAAQSDQEPEKMASSSEIDAAPGTLIITPDSFAPVTIATEREITAARGQTITDSLDEKPGITGSSFAPGASRPVVRGLDAYRVRVQENGIGSHDVSALSEDHAVPIDPFAADRIEVVRGPATLRYGSQAVGGVVAVENQRVPTYMPKGGIEAEIKGGLTSVDEGHDGAFSALAGAGGVVLHADAFRRDVEDYDTPRGTEINTFVESQGGSVGGSLVGRDGFLGAAFVRTESLYGIPGEASEESDGPRIDLVQDKMLVRGEYRPRSMGIDAVRFWAGLSDYAHDELAMHHREEESEAEHGAHEEAEEEGFEAGSRFTNKEQEARLEIQHQTVGTALGALDGAAGIQWGHRNMRGQSFEGDSLLEPAKTDTIAGFLFEELQITPTTRIQAAVRIEQNDVEGQGIEDPLGTAALEAFDRSFTPVSAGLGLLQDLPAGLTLRFNTQYVERAPDAAELFSKGVHEATGTFEIGNPLLSEEKAVTVEAGLQRAKGDLRFDGSVYTTWYDGFIFKERTGLGCGETLDTCGVEDELDQLVFGQRDARFYGIEMQGEADLARFAGGTFGVDGRYDFVRAQFEDGENVQRIPPHRLGGGLYWRDANWFLRWGVLHAFRQDEIGIAETETAGYTLMSAEISYTRALAGTGTLTPEMTIGLKGENLLDDEVRNHVSFKKDDVLEPGASIRLFGSMKLN